MPHLAPSLADAYVYKIVTTLLNIKKSGLLTMSGANLTQLSLFSTKYMVLFWTFSPVNPLPWRAIDFCATLNT